MGLLHDADDVIKSVKVEKELKERKAAEEEQKRLADEQAKLEAQQHSDKPL